MIDLEDELAEQYLTKCHEHLDTIRAHLLALENSGAGVDEERVNRAFRAVHLIQGEARLFGLVKVGQLAGQMEDALSAIRSRKAVLTEDRVMVLLQATEKLRGLIQSPVASNQADIAELIAALEKLTEDDGPPAVKRRDSAAGRFLRVLLVEDDFASRLLLQTFLSRYGECHVAVNGKEAVVAFGAALKRGQGYDLICMDIMMPEMDGREAVRQVRAMEDARGIFAGGAKIIMTTAVDDFNEVISCFRENCDSYLLKPIDLGKLLGLMKAYELTT